MLTKLVKNIPPAIPIKLAVVFYDTAFPVISPMLFLFANRILIDPLDAEESNIAIFLPTLPALASNKKWEGNYNVNISMYIARFKEIIDINLHFLMSSSKF